MSSKPKPVTLANTKTYGYQSQDPNNEYVKSFQAAETGVDPGVGRRTDLAEQDAANRWDSAFASGLPLNVRMQMQAAERRQIRSQGAAEAQQAEYAKNQQELAKRAMLLPQLVQTGGTEQQQGQPGQTGNMILGGIGAATPFILAAT